MSKVSKETAVVGKPLPVATNIPISTTTNSQGPVPFSQLLKPLPNLRERCTDLLLRAKASAAKKEECLEKVSQIMRTVDSLGEEPVTSSHATPVRADRGNGDMIVLQQQAGTFAKWEMTIEECAGSTAHHLSTANVLATKSEGCAHTAERSSSAVKRLDTLHSRVKWAREIVKRISESRTCISTIARALSQVSFKRSDSNNDSATHAPRTAREEAHLNDAIAAFAKYVQANQKLLELSQGEGENRVDGEDLAFIDYQVLKEPTESLIADNNEFEDEESFDGAFEPWLLLQASEVSPQRGSGGDNEEDPSGVVRTQGEQQDEEASLARSIAARAQKLLFREVSGRLQHAMSTGPREAVLASVESLASMGSHNETMKTFIHWVCSVSLAELASLVDNELGELKTAKNTEKSHLYSSSVALDHVVATLEREEEFVTSVFGNAGFIELLRHLHKRCTQHVARVIKDYIDRQHHIASGPHVAAKDLDRTLEEISHLVSCCQMYMSYVDGRYKEAHAHQKQSATANDQHHSITPSVPPQQQPLPKANKFASFVTDDNPLFEAIQSLLGVYIPMQQQYFRVAVSQTLQSDREGMQEFQEAEIKKLESVAKENCIVVKKNANAGLTSPSSGTQLPLTFAASATDSASQQALAERLESLLQAVAASSAISHRAGGNAAETGTTSTWFAGSGPSGTTPNYSPFDAPGTSPGQTAELKRLMNSITAASTVFGRKKGTGGGGQVLQSEVPDVAFIDDMFYVLRIALYRAFATKNPSITSAVILNILNIIHDEIAKEVIEGRLGGQLLPTGSFPHTSRPTTTGKSHHGNTTKTTTHEAVYFFDSSVEAYFATILDVSSRRGGSDNNNHGSSSSAAYSNIQSQALSPVFMKWLLASTQLPAYTRRLAEDIHKAANAAYGSSSNSNSLHETTSNASELKKFLELQHNFEELATCLEQNVDHLVFLTAGVAAQMFLAPLQTTLSPTTMNPLYLSRKSISDFNLTPDVLQRYFARADAQSSQSSSAVYIDPITGLASTSSAPTRSDVSTTASSGQSWMDGVTPQWMSYCEYIRFHVLIRNEELYERIMTHLVGWLTALFETTFLLPVIPRNWAVKVQRTASTAAGAPKSGNAATSGGDLGDTALTFTGRLVDVDGALQLDEDIRSLKSFFIDNSEIPPVRDKFARLTAVSSLMVVDNIRDAVEVSSTLPTLSRVDRARMLVGKLELNKQEIIDAIL